MAARASRPNEYWKLDTYHNLTGPQMKELLAARHYYVGSRTDKMGLRACLQRSDCGLISYTNLSNDELRHLIQARGLTLSPDPRYRGARCELVDTLEQADKAPRFQKFAELPAELRVRIYKMYFNDFKGPLTAPKQPPLTLACSLLRREALPVFYATCVFSIELRLPRKWHYQHMKISFKMKDMMLFWLYSLSKQNMACIKNLKLEIIDEAASTISGYSGIGSDFYIAYAKDEDKWHVTTQKTPLKNKNASGDMVALELLAVFRGPQERTRKLDLSKGLIFDLRKAAETGYDKLITREG